MLTYSCPKKFKSYPHSLFSFHVKGLHLDFTNSVADATQVETIDSINLLTDWPHKERQKKNEKKPSNETAEDEKTSKRH